MRPSLIAIIVAAAGFALPASAQVLRQSSLLARVGGPIPGSGADSVSATNSPFTVPDGRVGFFGTLSTMSGTVGFVFFNGAIVWRNSDAVGSVLTGGEGTIGLSNTGGFCYSPSDDGQDSVWTQSGALAVAGEPIPATSIFWSFASRPGMSPDGTAYFVAGERTTAGGSTSNRALYRAAFPGPVFTRIVGGGDVVDGYTMSSAATDFQYWVSDNNAHVIRTVTTTETSPNNTAIYLDGAIRHHRSTPTGSPLADNWGNYAFVGINNSGHYTMIGDTTAATSQDAFVAFDGRIKVREGGTIDGFTLLSGSTMRAVSINNRSNVGFIGGTTASHAVIFGYGPLLHLRGKLIVAVGDQVDLDGDTVADHTVTALRASTAVGPGLDIADVADKAWIEAQLTPIGGGTAFDAVIGFAIPCGVRCPADWDMNCTVEPADIAQFVNDWLASLSGPPLSADFDGNDTVEPADIAGFVNAWLAALSGGC